MVNEVGHVAQGHTQLLYPRRFWKGKKCFFLNLIFRVKILLGLQGFT